METNIFICYWVSAGQQITDFRYELGKWVYQFLLENDKIKPILSFTKENVYQG